MSELSTGLTTASAPTRPASPTAGSKPRVLVTDDLLLDRRMVTRILERQGGWEVAFASNSVEVQFSHSICPACWHDVVEPQMAKAGIQEPRSRKAREILESLGRV